VPKCVNTMLEFYPMPTNLNQVGSSLYSLQQNHGGARFLDSPSATANVNSNMTSACLPKTAAATTVAEQQQQQKRKCIEKSLTHRQKITVEDTRGEREREGYVELEGYIAEC